jgi:hypothetical protein
MADALYDGPRFLALTVMDEGNREALGIDVGRSIQVPPLMFLPMPNTPRQAPLLVST